MASTAQISIALFDGVRQPLSNDVKWSIRLSDGRAPSERKTYTYPNLQGSTKSFDVTFFDNFFDDYTVCISPEGFEDSGWFPVRVHPSAPSTIEVLHIPTGGEPHFAGSTWSRLSAARPATAAIVRAGCQSDDAAETGYGTVLESRPKALACFLNIVAALEEVRLPSGKSPLDYYWNVSWPAGDMRGDPWLERIDEVFKQDRFFCYVDAAILPDIRNAAMSGSFAPEPNPKAFHPDATESYKQTQFDVANVQLTFHGADTCSLSKPDGTTVSCIKVEPDIDYYKDVLTHGLLEVIPNWLTRGLTDPVTAFALRWMAGRRAGLPSFDPLYSIEPAAGRVAGATGR